MPGYRLYCRNDKGRIFRRDDIMAEDDAEAVERARDLCGDLEAELWSGSRLVKKFPEAPAG